MVRDFRKKNLFFRNSEQTFQKRNKVFKKLTIQNIYLGGLMEYYISQKVAICSCNSLSLFLYFLCYYGDIYYGECFGNYFIYVILGVSIHSNYAIYTRIDVHFIRKKRRKKSCLDVTKYLNLLKA